jgi:hypothetical protein
MKIELIEPIPQTTPIDGEEKGRPLFKLDPCGWHILINGILFAFLAGGCMRTDYGSIPRLLWRMYNPIDIRYQAAFLLHDFLFRAGAPFAYANDAMRECVAVRMKSMIKTTNPVLKAIQERNADFQAVVLWSAVSGFGMSAYRKNSEQTKIDTRAHMRYDGKIFPVMGWI